MQDSPHLFAGPLACHRNSNFLRPRPQIHLVFLHSLSYLTCPVTCPSLSPRPSLSPPNNVLEQDHRAIKRRIRASQHFRSFWGAWRTIAGYEAVHMIRKGQACWSAVGLLHRFIVGMFGMEV
jgi:hypothetical protein